MLQELLARDRLILAISRYEHRISGSVEQFKAVVYLVDGSLLHINEVRVSKQVQKYSYYWMTPAGALIQGWDNAPHHAGMSTYPHHTHVASRIEPSEIRTLAELLDGLERRLTP